MLKFNTAKLIRVVENIDNTMQMEDVVLAMLDDDNVVVSTITLQLKSLPPGTRPIPPGSEIRKTNLTSPEWGYYINENYEGWTIQELSNK